VFLFDTKGRLVLQKRSDAKITFPKYWANTCCSHPLWNAEEMEREGEAGVKRAAQRKLQQELGIEPDALPLTNFHWVGRVHYRAPCEDGLWGEHEIDHVLLAMPDKDIVVKPNPNEVQETIALGQDELREWLAAAPAAGTKVSAWFNVIQSEMLPNWWKAVTKVRSAQARGEDVDVASAFAPLRWSTILRAGDHVANAAASPALAAAAAAAAAAAPKSLAGAAAAASGSRSTDWKGDSRSSEVDDSKA
jgi:isopentenyl-diphosphate delta-isomerase